jgi:glyoxylase-like metal-dependent hydrolase (beta-lactamase superfamily II)
MKSIKTILLVTMIMGLQLSFAQSNVSKLFKVHQYASPAGGIFSNSYIIELDKSIIVVDGTLLVSTSKALKTKMDSIGKPLVGVLITHGHPDHYNGLGNITKKETPIYATQSVLNVITKSDSAKEKQWTPMFGDEWPKNRIFPNKTLANKGSVTFEGVTFTVNEVGVGESDADTYWVANHKGKKYAFIGDIVLEGVHAYLSDGHYKEWLSNLKTLRPTMNKMALIYPGHGIAGDAKMFDWQKGYLDTYVNTIKKISKGSNTLNDNQKAELVLEMKKYLPNDKLEFLISLGADVVATRMSKE